MWLDVGVVLGVPLMKAEAVLHFCVLQFAMRHFLPGSIRFRLN